MRSSVTAGFASTAVLRPAEGHIIVRPRRFLFLVTYSIYGREDTPDDRRRFVRKNGPSPSRGTIQSPITRRRDERPEGEPKRSGTHPPWRMRAKAKYRISGDRDSRIWWKPARPYGPWKTTPVRVQVAPDSERLFSARKPARTAFVRLRVACTARGCEGEADVTGYSATLLPSLSCHLPVPARSEGNPLPSLADWQSTER